MATLVRRVLPGIEGDADRTLTAADAAAIGLHPFADWIGRQPGFEAASLRTCRDVLDAYERHHAMMKLVTDQGQFHMAAQAFVLHPYITASGLRMLVPADVASTKRLEQYLHGAERVGILEPAAERRDNRERPLRLAPRFLAAMTQWVDAIGMPAWQWSGLPERPADHDDRRRWLLQFSAARRRDFHIHERAPAIARLTQLRGGNLLVLALSSLSPERPFSAKGFAARACLTRSQVQALLKLARAEGWIEGDGPELKMTAPMQAQAAQARRVHLALAACIFAGTSMAAMDADGYPPLRLDGASATPARV